MFERYTEKARRVIFFARYEASQFGSPYIETEHLLLGLVREDKALTNRFFRIPGSVESIRTQIEAHTVSREQVPTSVDLPLSNESKRVLAYAAEEAERLSDKHIATGHLLLGLLREVDSFAAALLRERGLALSMVRAELAQAQHGIAPGTSHGLASAVAEFSRDLTAAAGKGELVQVLGRDQEIDALANILAGPTRHSAVLIGDRGVGKSAIVQGLASRIKRRDVPARLWEKRVWELDPPKLAAGMKFRGGALTLLQAVLQELADYDSVVLISNLEMLMGGAGEEYSSGAAMILESAVSSGRIQFVFEATPRGYEEMVAKYAWFADCSRRLRVLPLREDVLLEVVRDVTGDLARRHAIVYADAAVEFAARQCAGHAGKAADALDAAAWRAKSRRPSLPEEVAAALREVKLLGQRMESEVANHEFAKARTYSDEIAKLRAKLKELYQKHQITESEMETVQREDVEYVLSRWLM
jgi:ATP-dependent Clp protease ATP-binding subunit ClpC